MNRITDYPRLKTRIVSWIKDYAITNNIKSLVVGVSGGIDSAVVSTLCAKTGLPTYVLSMPLLSKVDNDKLSDSHANTLEKKYDNVTKIRVELSGVYDKFIHSLNWWTDSSNYTSNELANANKKSRLRMVTLYQVAGTVGGILLELAIKLKIMV